MGRTVLHGILLSIVLSSVSLGISANPEPFSKLQPDGTRINLYIRGDEHNNWLEDVDGYTVVKDTDSYVYSALGPDMKLSPTSHLVGKVSPESIGLSKRILPIKNNITQTLGTPDAYPGASVLAVPPSGNIKNLVILCKFSDHVTGTDTRDEADYDTSAH